MAFGKLGGCRWRVLVELDFEVRPNLILSSAELPGWPSFMQNNSKTHNSELPGKFGIKDSELPGSSAEPRVKFGRPPYREMRKPMKIAPNLNLVTRVFSDAARLCLRSARGSPAPGRHRGPKKRPKVSKTRLSHFVPARRATGFWDHPTAQFPWGSSLGLAPGFSGFSPRGPRVFPGLSQVSPGFSSGLPRVFLSILPH